MKVLKSKSINKDDLPAIIHHDHIIYELNRVMNYLCITFQREDLLGVDIRQKVKMGLSRPVSVKYRNSIHKDWLPTSASCQGLSQKSIRLTSKDRSCFLLWRKNYNVSSGKLAISKSLPLTSSSKISSGSCLTISLS
jgi:hypothetical protein